MLRPLKALVIMSRPHNLAISILGVSIGVLIVASDLDVNIIYNILFLSVPVILVASAGYISNDIYDLESDKISKPWRPLVKGYISARSALLVAYIFFISSMIYSIIFIGIYTFIFVALNSILVLLYNAYLKKYGIIGNLAVSFSSANTIIYGSLALVELYDLPYSRIYISLIPMVFAVLLSLIRELLKGIEDLEGDKAKNVRTLAISIGVRKTSILSILLSIVLWILTLIPMYIKFNIAYLVLSQVTVALAFVSSILIYMNSIEYRSAISTARKVRSLTKISLGTGVITFLVWSL